MRGIPLAMDGGRNPDAGKPENEMNKPLIGTIVFCALAAVAASFAFERGPPTDDLNGNAPATIVVTAPVHASPAREFLPESDTTGLLQDSLTVEDLLEEIDADSGDEFTPTDRERLAVELRDALGD
jgi:hypothetical protein